MRLGLVPKAVEEDQVVEVVEEDQVVEVVEEDEVAAGADSSKHRLGHHGHRNRGTSVRTTYPPFLKRDLGGLSKSEFWKSLSYLEII